jgi:FdrA protein
LIAQGRGGISHALGTGGRDLKPEVGAVTTLMAIDALDADVAT